MTPSLIREWHKLLIHKAEGYALEQLPNELAPEEVMVYRPSAVAGARAPHVWLKDGGSTLDLFGPGFTLLRLGATASLADEITDAAGAARRAAQSCGMCRARR